MEIIYNRKRECGTMNLKDIKKSLGDIEDLLNKHMSSPIVKQKENIQIEEKVKISLFMRLSKYIRSLYES